MNVLAAIGVMMDVRGYRRLGLGLLTAALVLAAVLILCRILLAPVIVPVRLATAVLMTAARGH